MLKLFFLYVMFLLSSVTVLGAPKQALIKPCKRSVDVTELTRLVVPMIPFRGVNLIFPFDLADTNTTYSISSNNIWSFVPAKGGNIVPVNFKQFKGEWGEINDLMIEHDGYVFSLALVAVQDLKQHCTNIVFKLSEAERKKMEEKEKKRYLDALKREYQEKFDDLDNQANHLALDMIGELVTANPYEKNIKEEQEITLSNGDILSLYVDKMYGYGRFSVLSIELNNDSDVKPLYVKKVEVFSLGSNDSKKSRIRGSAKFGKKMKQGEVQEMSFSTLDNIPSSGAMVVVTTDRGKVEVKW